MSLRRSLFSRRSVSTPSIQAQQQQQQSRPQALSALDLVEEQRSLNRLLSAKQDKKPPKVEVHVNPKFVEVLHAGEGITPFFARDLQTNHPTSRATLEGTVRFFTGESLPISFVAVYLVGTVSFDTQPLLSGTDSDDSSLRAWKESFEQNGRIVPSTLNHTFYASDPTVLWPVNAHGKVLTSKQTAVPLKTILDFKLHLPWSHVAPSLDLPGSGSISWSVVACVALRSPSRPTPSSSSSLLQFPSSPKSDGDDGSPKVRFKDEDNLEAPPLPSKKKGKLFSILSGKSSGEKKVIEGGAELTAFDETSRDSPTPDGDEERSSYPTLTHKTSELSLLGSGNPDRMESTEAPRRPVDRQSATSPTQISTIAAAATASPDLPAPASLAIEALGIPSMDAILRKMNGVVPDAQLASKRVQVRYTSPLLELDSKVLVGKNKVSSKSTRKHGVKAGAVICRVLLPDRLVMGLRANLEVNVEVVDKEAIGSIRAISVALITSEKFNMDAIPLGTLHTTDLSSPTSLPIDSQMLPSSLSNAYSTYQSTRAKIITKASPGFVKFNSAANADSGEDKKNATMVLNVPRCYSDIGGTSQRRRRNGKEESHSSVDILDNEDDASGVIHGPSVRLPYLEIRHHLRIDIYHELAPSVITESSTKSVPEEEDTTEDPFSDNYRTDAGEDTMSPQVSGDGQKRRKRRLGKLTVYLSVGVVHPSRSGVEA
ncbi:hypothetical protein HDU67_002634 [Dinochytrium kinnereticum]|nr:hypothetical protein HDU67_002634 [Dinochytrium kinnereticum]